MGRRCGRYRHRHSVPGIKQLWDTIDQGQAALLIGGETRLEQVVDTAGLKPENREARTKELDGALTSVARHDGASYIEVVLPHGDIPPSLPGSVPDRIYEAR